MEITSRDFKENVYDYESASFQGKKPVMIEFFTDWCQACKSMSPMLDSLGSKYKDRVDVFKVNISKDDDLVNAMEVQSVPTILFMKPGKGVTKTLTGSCNSNTLENAISEYLF